LEKVSGRLFSGRWQKLRALTLTARPVPIDIARINADRFNWPLDAHKSSFRCSVSTQAIAHISKGDWEMSVRLSRLAMSLLIVAAVVLMSGRCWAVFYLLNPSKDEWGLKYDVEVTDGGEDKLNVLFTLADQGRLKPIHSATVVAFTPPDSSGGQSYLVKSRIKLQPTKEGKRAGQVQIPKKFSNIAVIRILTQRVDGRPQTAGAAYYDIPLRRFINKTPVVAAREAAPAIASPATAQVAK
jgi:hypothetical protein